MIAPRHEQARLQSDFYRDQFHRLLRWLMVCLLIMAGLMISVVYVILSEPAVPYYANTLDGMILNMPVPTTATRTR